ncbi:MAG: hypothetical protein GXP13_04415 [Gammaproteobacteria bacterium]|nr:hypothetical protein [Gammaproteobacteria bacterium]
MSPKVNRLELFLIFMAVTLLLSLCSIWLLSHNYVNEFALSRWAKVLSVLDSPETRIEHLGLIYPHFPVYVLMPFYYLPGLDSGAAPFFASVVVGAILIGIWNYHLARKQYSLSIRLAMILLVVSHPYFLWGITTGAQHALSLLMFYWLYMALVRLVNVQDVRSFIMIGLVLAIYFFIDERTFYLFMALLPLISIIAPKRMLRESTTSVYLIIAAPLAVSVASWAYLNWIFHNDASLFLSSSGSAFRGAWQDTPHISWLRSYGGDFFTPTILTGLLSLMAYPVLFWLLYHAKRHRILLGSTLVLLIHPVVASGLATSNYFLEHPMNMVFLFSAGIMAGIVLLPRETKSARMSLLALLALSSAMAWFSFSWFATADMQRWQSAVMGKSLKDSSPGDVILGQWLDKNRQVTLLDDKTAYRVIVARGDAKNLILPFSSKFKTNMKNKWPKIAQLAVSEPGYIHNKQDHLNQRFPDLYYKGMPGYKLVYDNQHWRVYRQIISGANQ